MHPHIDVDHKGVGKENTSQQGQRIGGLKLIILRRVVRNVHCITVRVKMGSKGQGLSSTQTRGSFQATPCSQTFSFHSELSDLLFCLTLLPSFSSLYIFLDSCGERNLREYKNKRKKERERVKKKKGIPESKKLSLVYIYIYTLFFIEVAEKKRSNNGGYAPRVSFLPH